MTTVLNSDRYQKMALGKLENVKPHVFAGDRYSLPIGTACTSWTGPADIYTFATSGNPITHFSSSSALDTGPIHISGLDLTWKEKNITVNLAGQTKTQLYELVNEIPVPISLLRLNGAQSLVDLNGGVSIYQDVSVTNGVPDDDDAVKGYIDPIANLHYGAFFTVPDSFEAIIRQEFVHCLPPNGGTVEQFVYARPYDFEHDTTGPTYLQGRFLYGRTTTTIQVLPLEISFSFGPRTDLWTNVISSGANASFFTITSCELARI